MKYLKVHKPFTFFWTRIDIIYDNELFQCKDKIDGGFEILKNNNILIKAIPERENKSKFIRFIAVKDQMEICKIYPRLFFSNKEFFIYKSSQYLMPTFRNNELEDLKMKFSKWFILDLPKFGKKKYVVELDEGSDFMLAISIVAYMQRQFDTD